MNDFMDFLGYLYATDLLDEEEIQEEQEFDEEYDFEIEDEEI